MASGKEPACSVLRSRRYREKEIVFIVFECVSRGSRAEHTAIAVKQLMLSLLVLLLASATRRRERPFKSSSWSVRGIRERKVSSLVGEDRTPEPKETTLLLVGFVVEKEVLLVRSKYGDTKQKNKG
ncbi:hypothetical protein K2173_024903 [Erythroxylum novogranatense]|uniref:Uncharacterized protein n=1 Tax=Erythroxylum novogranatense TaxID=1862640 RepID=A0AAV8UGT3_9ROSI|nr:hypothetical protein K2173_024903 [Erythroxylum novogranatense]